MQDGFVGWLLVIFSVASRVKKEENLNQRSVAENRHYNNARSTFFLPLSQAEEECERALRKGANRVGRGTMGRRQRGRNNGEGFSNFDSFLLAVLAPPYNHIVGRIAE